MTLRPCLDCSTPTPKTRCQACEATRQRARNASRPQYAGSWDRTSKAARKGVRECNRCGVPFDPTSPKRRSTLDHTTNLVLCQTCNSSIRRNPQ